MSEQTSATRTGGCLCEAVRYTVSGDPVAQAVCHCTHCQKQSGSAFSIIIGFPDAAVSVEGDLTIYADQGESGNPVGRRFCGKCGSPIISDVAVTPGITWIKAGTLDDPKHLAPAMHVWGKSKQDWVKTGDVPCFAENPD